MRRTFFGISVLQVVIGTIIIVDGVIDEGYGVLPASIIFNGHGWASATAISAMTLILSGVAILCALLICKSRPKCEGK